MSDNQCDRIGQVLNINWVIFLHFVQIFEDILIKYHFVRLLTYWAIFGNFGLLLTFTFGHTGYKTTRAPTSSNALLFKKHRLGRNLLFGSVEMENIFSERTLTVLTAVWPDWVIYCTLGSFLKPVATIIMLKLPTFFGNFCQDVEILHFLVKSFWGNFYGYLATFYWSHWPTVIIPLKVLAFSVSPESIYYPTIVIRAIKQLLLLH